MVAQEVHSWSHTVAVLAIVVVVPAIVVGRMDNLKVHFGIQTLVVVALVRRCTVLLSPE